MNKIIAILLTAVVVCAATLWTSRALARRANPEALRFLESSDDLIKALQEYRKFVGNYPTGTSVDIANSLSGQSDSNKKVLVLATPLKQRSPKGEILDPWGNPLQFYFAQTSILIRSAGPNGVFEDCSIPGADDLYRTDSK